jgi:hypothetical protein
LLGEKHLNGQKIEESAKEEEKEEVVVDDSNESKLKRQLRNLKVEGAAVAREFGELLRELVTFPEKQIAKETVEAVHAVLVQHASFYTALFPCPNESISDTATAAAENWTEFENLQNVS